MVIRRKVFAIVASVAAACVVVAVVLGIIVLDSAVGDRSDECDPGPMPARTPPPADRGATPVAWLGPQHLGLRFHSVSYRRLAQVNYGNPIVRDACSGSGYHFDISVLTAARRPETRRRLRRSLGAGVPTRLGTRYGCRRSANPRIALLRATIRIEVIGITCDQSIAASRQLRPASDGR